MAGSGARVNIYGDWDGSAVKKAVKDLGDLDDKVKSSSGAFGGIASGLKGLAVAAGAAFAAKEVYDFAKASVTAAQDAAVADARLKEIAGSMGLVGGAYKGGLTRLNEYSSALQTQIGVEDESIKAVQAKLMTFAAVGSTMNQAGGAMDRATAAAYDLASAGFGTAESNAVQLGKALQDPVKGLASLARAGVTFTAAEKDKIKALVESGKAGEAQNLILAAIEKQVGGTAAATATASDKIKVAFSEIQEGVGGAFLPLIEQLATTLLPIFDDLKEPLKTVAESIAGGLSQALKALSPVLPVIADAIGSLAKTLGGALSTAITALIPIVTPLLETFADLATRIGPLLEPLLMKIGELLGKVMEAVMPLLQPLMDLVFTILEAAMPILDIVVDLFGTLIDALAPLFDIVGQLLGPLGELVKVLFKAIEPILRPLMPLIEALAAVFGDLLARAIGIIITALGGLIIAGSKMASFMLDNVTKPVINAFLTFAETIVGAAATAFGWVPGLGDKLETAKAAIGDFKKNAVSAIGDAATTIGQEGTRIGQSLVDNGVALASNPASTAKARKAGEKVGGALSEGMAGGITANQDGIELASRRTVNAAERAARAAAESNSPSMLFYRIGEDLTEGMKQGMMVRWPSLAAQVGKDIEGLSLQMRGGAAALGKGFAEAFDKAVTGFQERISAQVDIAKSAVDSLKSYSKGVVGNVLGSIFDVQTKDAEGNDLTPEQIFNNMLGGADAWQGAISQALPFIGQLPKKVAEWLYQQPPDEIKRFADYFAAHPDMLAQLKLRYDELAKWTKTNLGDPMAAAFATVGDDSAMEMLTNAKAKIKEQAKDFKEYVKDQLGTTITVKVNYDTGGFGGRDGDPATPMATGGIVTRPTFALIGEAGPEAVIPLSRGANYGVGTGDTYNITVQAGVGDPAAIGRTVVESIRAYERRSGKVFQSA